eukprot:2118219-Amphidinium_carterae.1
MVVVVVAQWFQTFQHGTIKVAKAAGSLHVPVWALLSVHSKTLMMPTPGFLQSFATFLFVAGGMWQENNYSTYRCARL